MLPGDCLLGALLEVLTKFALCVWRAEGETSDAGTAAVLLFSSQRLEIWP